MDRRPLVTARDLQQDPRLVVPPGALLTPLARDLLRQRGVTLRAGPARDVQARRLIVANWKSHKTIPEALAFASALRERADRAGASASGRPGVAVGGAASVAARPQAVVCPPATALASLAGPLRGVAELGAQDVSAHGEGPHTGQLAARHLVDAGCRFAIVGHSERRAGGETDADCRAKVRAALGGGLDPILCVGETRAERDAGRAELVVADQLRAACEGLGPERLARVVVAYEPRWAIGQGVTPTPAEVTDMLGHVRRSLARVVSADAEARVSVLYGGSVKDSNAAELLHLPGCSGALIGGAALDPGHFARILDLG